MDDLISRQAAIEVADAVWTVTGDKNVAKVWQQIKDLPSAERRGQWIDITKCGGCSVFKCSECGDLQLEESYYCPNCGARMDGEDK